jgi:hypothetical protein
MKKTLTGGIGIIQSWRILAIGLILIVTATARATENVLFSLAGAVGAVGKVESRGLCAIPRTVGREENLPLVLIR